MPKSTVLKLDDYREKRDLRLKLSASLQKADPGRAELVEHLARLAFLVSADRVATVWIDEYGPGVVHPHVVLDLLCDRPRRSFALEPLGRAWENGVPGVLETGGESRNDAAPWTLAVALGSDGTRSWFLVADAIAPRPTLGPDRRDMVMFVAGECSAVVLHRDLDAAKASEAGDERGRRPRFAGWPILQDIEGREDDEAESRRIAVRFIVARLPRLLAEDDMAIPRDRLRQQAERAREEVRSKLRDTDRDGEARLWDDVLDAFQDGDLEALGAALLELGAAVEGRSHLHGATELYALAYEMFAAVGMAAPAVEAARFAGRAQRRLARWADAHRWYGIARQIAETASMEHKVAVILDGEANIHRDRGNHPAAREALREAETYAVRSGDRRAIASVHHGLLALEHVAGNLDEAMAHGWKAVVAYPARRDQVEALASLAGALIDAGELQAAEDAWSIVSHISGEAYYRLFAFEALAYVAALRGDAALFARRAAAADAGGWESGPHTARADILLHRGLAFRALGRGADARRWLERALAFAKEHRFSRTAFEAEEALRLIDGGVRERVGAPQNAHEPSSTATEEVRQGLQRMRREIVGASA